MILAIAVWAAVRHPATADPADCVGLFVSRYPSRTVDGLLTEVAWVHPGGTLRTFIDDRDGLPGWEQAA